MAFGLSHRQSPLPRNTQNEGTSTGRATEKGGKTRRRWGTVRADDDQEQWYIPYNGPYEPPPSQASSSTPYRKQRDRDSWGDPIYGEGDGYGVEKAALLLEDPELHHRYGRETHTSAQSAGSSQRRPRAHSQSAVSAVSSERAVDPAHRPSTAGPRPESKRRRSATTSTSNSHREPHREPHPLSFAAVDGPGGGGIGESPSPRPYLQQQHRDSSSASIRQSLASIFSFVNSPDKRRSTPSRSRSGSVVREPLPPNPTSVPPLRIVKGRGPAATSAEEYYDSYYSTLSGDEDAEKKPESPLHPYAYVPSLHSADKAPRASSPLASRAPLTLNLADIGNHTNHKHINTSHVQAQPQLAIVAPVPKPSSHTYAHLRSGQQLTAPPTLSLAPPPPPALRELKNSSSTPDLRKETKSPMARAKERWLSAETWCDAILFPRPRFRIKEPESPWMYEQAERERWHRRRAIVSPPGSPLGPDFGRQPGQLAVPPNALESRVLAHSRSLNDMRQAARTQSPLAPVVPPLVVQPVAGPSTAGAQGGGTSADAGGLRPPRPKSFAMDDLALPSPVPSLQRVLEEGQILEHQRKRWQMQAKTSLGNKQARKLSISRSAARTRARANSESHKDSDKKRPHFPPDQTFLDFVAARSLLGNQNPVHVSVARPKSTRARAESDAQTTTKSSSGHGHSNSLSKKASRSTASSGGKGHTRNDSWGRTALRAAAKGLCGADEVTPTEEKKENPVVVIDVKPTEGDLRAGGGNGPHQQQQLLAQRLGPSPTPSGVSDSHMGIALSTPPPRISDEDRQDLKLPGHPFAQGGMYANYGPAYPTGSRPPVPPELPAKDIQQHRRERSADYAGAHPVERTSPTTAATEFSSISFRHKLPPQQVAAVAQAQHPYAQVLLNKRDSYQSEGRIVPRARADSHVPPPEKMWALYPRSGGSGSSTPTSGGLFANEILPDEIRYSPYVSAGHVPAYASPGIGERSPLRQQQSLAQLREEDKEQLDRNSVMILDTIGVGEVLANAIKKRHSKDSGIGTSEEHSLQPHPYYYQETKPETPPRLLHRKPVQYDASLPPYVRAVHQEEEHSPEKEDADTSKALLRTDSVANLTTSSSSSQQSPRALGGYGEEDMEPFRDLFYRPSLSREDSSEMALAAAQASLAAHVLTEDSGSRPRPALTRLERQLSAMSSRGSHRKSASTGGSVSTGQVPHTPETGLHFTVSDNLESASLVDAGPLQIQQQMAREEAGRGGAFHRHTVSIPEDIESSRASSPLERSIEDESQENYTVRQVESLSTPPIVSPGDHRRSFSGQMSFAALAAQGTRTSYADTEPPASPTGALDIPGAHRRSRVSSSQYLAASPLSGADGTRSSFLTSSDSSTNRMSNLSDFPAPPSKLTPTHMSLLNSYFEGISPGEGNAESHGPAKSSSISSPGSSMPRGAWRSNTNGSPERTRMPASAWES